MKRWLIIFCLLTPFNCQRLLDTLYYPAGHRLSLYPKDCTGHCHQGVSVDFAFQAQSKCPEGLSWYQNIEAFDHAKCFNHTKRVCSYCIMKEPRGMFVSSDCLYSPPASGCKLPTHDLHRGTCSQCDKIKNYKNPQSHKTEL